MKTPAIILDRDGVINKNFADDIKSLSTFELYPRSIKAIAQIVDLGWPVFIITNEASIAHGKLTEAALTDIHRELFKEVIQARGDIQAIYFCPHKASDKCECRKPKPGLFKQLALEHNIDLMKSYYIGDHAHDVTAGINAGCTPILVRSGHGLENFDKKVVIDHAVLIFDDLLHFVEAHLSN